VAGKSGRRKGKTLGHALKVIATKKQRNERYLKRDTKTGTGSVGLYLILLL